MVDTPDSDVVTRSRFDASSFRRLWTITLLLYGVGDMATTTYLIWFSGTVEEANAAVLFVVDAWGLWGFVALKLLVFGVAIAIALIGARSNDRFLYYVPPVTLAVAGAFSTAFNLRLLVG